MTTNSDVWMTPVSGGDPKKITMSAAADQQPLFSPDGKILAIESQRRAGFEADRWYLDLYDPSTGVRRTCSSRRTFPSRNSHSRRTEKGSSSPPRIKGSSTCSAFLFRAARPS